MGKAAKPSETRPALTVRIGVTGSRHMDESDIERLRPQVAHLLGRVRELLAGLEGQPQVRRIYRQDEAGAARARLRMISPLAEGADRLAAQEALRAGYQLHAPFPFPQIEYEKDFHGELTLFRSLAEQASIFALDGGRGEDESESYEAVGRYVVRNSDILLALWDGRPAQGRGGTAEIVDYATRVGVPVWWIHMRSGEARLLFSPRHFKHPELALQSVDHETALADHLKRLILPAQPARAREGGLLGRAARWIADEIGAATSPLDAYLDETTASNFCLWRAHGAMMNLLAPAPRGDGGESREPPVAGGGASAVETWWADHYRRADALSQAYGDRYRSSYVWITLLAFLGFLTSSIFEVRPKLAWPVWLELAVLVVIAALVMMNHMRSWQERWIAYRLIAELCRNQLVLSPLGRTLPGSEILLSAEETGADAEEPAAASEAWVGWYFLAVLRGAPTPEGDALAARRRAFELARELVVEQKAYHQRRRRRAAAADRRLVNGGSIFFILVLAGVALHLWLTYHGRLAAVETLNVVVPVFSAMSAALVGLRAYAELSLLARQSLRMEKSMQDIEDELGAFDIDEPLASKKLGVTLHRLALLLLHEVRGWAQVFRLKSVETA